MKLKRSDTTLVWGSGKSVRTETNLSLGHEICSGRTKNIRKFANRSAEKSRGCNRHFEADVQVRRPLHGLKISQLLLQKKGMYVLYLANGRESLCYRCPAFEALSFFVTSARAFLQFGVSRSIRHSLPDSDNIPEGDADAAGISCVLYRNCV